MSWTLERLGVAWARGRIAARTWLVLITVPLAIGACASPVPPQMKVFAPIDAGTPRRLYVSTTAERGAVVSALEGEGFSVSSALRDTPLVLSARLGRERSRRKCGAMRNVVYDLRHAGLRIAFIKGRGRTGTCTPNILVDMSHELARLFERPQ